MSRSTYSLTNLDDGVLLWQVACEYISASRKLAQFGYDQTQAEPDISDLRKAWKTLLPSWSVIDRVDILLRKYRLSIWDALTVAACLECGVTRLYSEDFNASVKSEGLEIINPF